MRGEAAPSTTREHLPRSGPVATILVWGQELEASGRRARFPHQPSSPKPATRNLSTLSYLFRSGCTVEAGYVGFSMTFGCPRCLEGLEAG
nr:hypothetical protein [Candidatus Freyrarchaeum guaymaensis]